MEHVHLSVPFVAIRNKDINITAVVWPSQAGTLTYFWWFGNSTKVRLPFDLHLFAKLVAPGQGIPLTPMKTSCHCLFHVIFFFLLSKKRLLLIYTSALCIFFFLSHIILRISYFFLHLVVICPTELWRPLFLPEFTCNVTELCISMYGIILTFNTF